MADLEANLELLKVMVPAVPGQIAPVAKQAAEAITAAGRLIEDVEEKREEAKTLLEKVTAALTGLRDDARKDRQRLEEALSKAEAALRAAVAVLEEGEENVREAAEGTGQALDQLQQELVRTAARGTAAVQALYDKASTVAVGFSTAQSDIDSAVGTAAGTAEQIENVITSGLGTLESAAAVLTQEVAPVPGAVKTLLGDCTQRMATELSTMQGEVGAALTQLKGDADGAVEALREALVENQEPLDQAVMEAQKQLAALGETAVTPLEDLAEGRGDADSGTTNLGPQMTTVETGVENLRQVAATAGWDWPDVTI
jgi:uncharacterized protein YoxC